LDTCPLLSLAAIVPMTLLRTGLDPHAVLIAAQSSRRTGTPFCLKPGVHTIAPEMVCFPSHRQTERRAMISALLLFAVLALTVYGQLMMKSRAVIHAADFSGALPKLHYLAVMFMDVRVLSALVAAVLAAICWMLAIARLDVGYAYPFMALSFVLVPVGSMLIFGEPLPRLQLCALALIIAGVSLSALAR
jgi:multidrug transporter EmrE-like cation transporter